MRNDDFLFSSDGKWSQLFQDGGGKSKENPVLRSSSGVFNLLEIKNSDCFFSPHFFYFFLLSTWILRLGFPDIFTRKKKRKVGKIYVHVDMKAPKPNTKLITNS